MEVIFVLYIDGQMLTLTGYKKNKTGQKDIKTYMDYGVRTQVL